MCGLFNNIISACNNKEKEECVISSAVQPVTPVKVNEIIFPSPSQVIPNQPLHGSETGALKSEHKERLYSTSVAAIRSHKAMWSWCAMMTNKIHTQNNQ